MGNESKPYAVILDETMSKPYDSRYIVISETTGEVLDDAQGYGYRSPENAYRAYGYKTRDRSKDRAKKAKQRAIKKWARENQIFMENMTDIALQIAKGRMGTDAKMDSKLVKKLLSDMGDVPFTASELLSYWKSPR